MNGGWNRWWSRSLLFAFSAAVLWGNGCVVVEKQSIFVDLPKDEDTVEIVFVYEGISADPKYTDRAAQAVKSKRFHPWHLMLFYIEEDRKSAETLRPDDLWRQYFRQLSKRTTIEQTEYYLDKSRERQLCAYQRVTFADRTMLVDGLNTLVNKSLQEFFKQDLEAMQASIKEMREQAEREPTSEEEKQIREYGLQPLVELAKATTRMFDHLDAGSLEKLRAAVEGQHRWVQCDSGTLEFVIPITAEVAKDVVDDPESKKLLADLKLYFPDAALLANAEGLRFKLGKSAQPIVMQYVDERPAATELDPQLIQAAGNPKPLADFEKQKDKISLAEYLLSLEEGEIVLKSKIPARKISDPKNPDPTEQPE